jgi:hypothetical protein
VNFPKAFSDRRVDDRLQSFSLEIVLDGVQYPAIDWSLSGFLVTDYYGARTPGEKVEGSFRICTDMKSHPFKAVVVRHNSTTGRLALNFTNLSLRSISVLEALMTGRNGV